MNAKQIMTIWKDEKVIQREEILNVLEDDGEHELNVINIYPQMRGQRMIGFGGAITAAVANVLEQMPAQKAEEILEAYYGAGGIGYRMIRTSIDSCDFSPVQYCADNQEDDAQLLCFSIEYDEKHIIPWIHKIYQIAGEALPVMLSPWSPPAYMKTNQTRIKGGRLKPEYYERWARYLCRYIKEYQRRGVQVAAVSVQNEPNAIQAWDSCLYSAEEERFFLSEYLYPQMCKEDLGDIDVYIWDHNKERLFDRACEEITDETDQMISGVAFHWYSGDHFDALRLTRQRFPDKHLLFSEGCIEYRLYDTDQLINANKYAHDMLGNFVAGMDGFLDWNICLDENGGPNYVGNYCEAPIMCNTLTGEAGYKLSYYYIGHCSKYISQGATLLALTKYTNDISAAAFENPDESIVLILCNEKKEDAALYVRLSGQIMELNLAGDSMSTVLINEIR